MNLTPEEIGLVEKVITAVLTYLTWKTRRDLDIAYGKIRELQGLGSDKVRRRWVRKPKQRGKDSGREEAS